MFRLGFVKNPETGHELYLNKLSIPYITPSGVIDIRFRSLNNESGPKYLSRPGASTHIYNITALSKDNGMLVICEGEIDTIIATQVGLIAVGLPGANNWKPFYSKILDDFDTVIVLADGDSAGMDFGKKVSRELGNVNIVQMPEGHDVNSIVMLEGAEFINERIRKCLSE